MSKFLSPRLEQLEPYVPGEQPQGRQFTKLNTNESPFPPAPGVISALSTAQIEALNLYPDPDARDAHAELAAHFGLQPKNVLLGNGSDEILAFCFQAFCDAATPACYPDISYDFYEVFARLFGLPTKVIPLNNDFCIDKTSYYMLGGTAFIANPNAPTGLALPLADIASILENNRRNVVIIDEAYVDFGAESARSLIDTYDNLLVVQTMSKSRNLAGARLGFALGNEELIKDLNRIKFSFNPYNVNRLSLLAATAALRDDAYFRQCTGEIRHVRTYTTDALTARGFTVLHSAANFVFARPAAIGGKAYCERLRDEGVLVRHFNKARIGDYVRIAIGTQAQMDALLQATDNILKAR